MSQNDIFFLSFSLLCYVKNIMTKLLLIWWLMILFFYRKVKWQQNWIDLTMRCCCHHHFLQCYFVIDYMHTSPTYYSIASNPNITNFIPFLKPKFQTQTQIRKNQILNRNWEPIRHISSMHSLHKDRLYWKTMALLTGLQHSQY